jgi:hypothetical protein
MKSLPVLVVAFLIPAALSARAARYYPDDPLTREPETQDASRAQPRDILLAWDTLGNLFGTPGDRADLPAMDANTVDEVPDSSWFSNRGPLTPTLVAGAADTTSGPAQGPWTVISGKSDGITPGFTIRDPAGRRWFLKFDPPKFPELATGAEMVSTKLLWALGYNVPENHVACLVPDMLRIAPSARMKDEHGRTQRLTMADVYRLLSRAARRSDGTYRVLASRALEGKPIGGFLYFGTRSDDPNDVIPHEHRRSLRALRVFGGWLNHVDAKAINTLDTIVDARGGAVVRHHLLDFGSTLGSAGIGPHDYEEGHEYVYSGLRPLLNAALVHGFRAPAYRHIRYDVPRSVGRFDVTAFDPATWKPRVPNAAFSRARPEDLFWAATKLAGVTVPMIEAAVGSGRYSDPAAERYLIDALVLRRQRILESYLTAANPIVNPSLTPDGELRFENIAVASGIATFSAGYQTDWYLYDNDRDSVSPMGAASSTTTRVLAPAALPFVGGAFVRIDVRAATPAPDPWRRPVTLTFRRADEGWQLAGLDRHIDPPSMENSHAPSAITRRPH